MRNFADWQRRIGLTRASDAAKALGIARTHVYQFVRGDRQPDRSMRRLMAVLEWLKREHGLEPPAEL